MGCFWLFLFALRRSLDRDKKKQRIYLTRLGEYGVLTTVFSTRKGATSITTEHSRLRGLRVLQVQKTTYTTSSTFVRTYRAHSTRLMISVSGAVTPVNFSLFKKWWREAMTSYHRGHGLMAFCHHAHPDPFFARFSRNRFFYQRIYAQQKYHT